MFISFEGVDGVGKSTQVEVLAHHLERAGHRVLTTFQPGVTKLGEKLRELALHSDIDKRARTLLFAADQAEQTAKIIRPALEDGKIVITDRYYDSAIVYNGAGEKLDEEEIRLVSEFSTAGLKPDLTILLTGGFNEERIQSRGNKKDVYEKKGIQFFEDVEKAYIEMAKQEPDRFVVIDGRQTIEDIAEKILYETQQALRKHMEL